MFWSPSTFLALCPSVALFVGGVPPVPPEAAETEAGDTEEFEPETETESESEPELESLAVPESEPAPEPAPAPAPEPESEPMPPAGNYDDELDLDPHGMDRSRDQKVGRTLRITGTAINGVGVGLLVGAGVLFVMRHRAVNDLDAAADDADPAKREGPVTDIERREQLALGLTIAAGATLVVGTTLWAIGLRRTRRAARTASLPTPFAGRGTAGLTWKGSF